MFSLAGRRAVLTGGAGGLGSAIAYTLAAQGASVAICDLRPDAAANLAASIVADLPDATAVGIEMDVTDEESVLAAIAAARDALGGHPEVVVPAAGVGELKAIEEMTFAEWRAMLAVHLDGTFLPVRHTIGPMLEHGFGRIICFSSIASLQGVAKQAHYAAGKGGIDGLVRSFSREVAGRGVTVNAIAPGYFESPLNDLAPPGRIEALTANVPLGRFGHPREIGALVAFLASEEAAYLTGEIISPNGGFTYCHHLDD